MSIQSDSVEVADPEILDAELHPEARLRAIQRRMQEEEGVRLTIDTIAYVLRFNEEFDAEQEAVTTD